MLWSTRARIADSTAWHAHEVFEFILCAANCSGRLELPEYKLEFHPDRSILIPPGVRHRYLFGPDEAASIKLVCLTPQDVTTFLSPALAITMQQALSSACTVADHGDQSHHLAALSALIRDGFGVGGDNERHIVWGAIGLLLAMHDKARDQPDDAGWLRYNSRMAQVRDWLELNLERSITLDQVAAHFGLSRSLLTREFRRHTGKSFIDYCNHRRIEKAAVLLASDQVSISQAAFDSGFANLSHFHRQFKAIFGLTPAAFRLKIGQGVAS